MVNQNSNNRRRNNRHRNRRTRLSHFSAKATGSYAQVRAAYRQSPSPSRSPSPSSYSSSPSYSDDCLHPSCIKHCFPSGRTTHANRRCFRLTNPRRFEGILLKRGFYDRETHRSSEDTSSSDMAATSAGHAQQFGTANYALDENFHPRARAQCGTAHYALDENFHPRTRAQHTQTVENHCNGLPNDDEPKIKDTLYLFKNNNNGQKNLWGLVPEEEEMRDVKKRSSSAPTPAVASKKNKSQQARRRYRQSVAAAAVRRQRALKSLQNQYKNEFPPCCDARPRTLFDGKFRGCRPGFRDSAMSVLIKGIEFTAVAAPHRQRSCISTEVAEGLGLCEHIVCYYNDALSGGGSSDFVKQTVHSIPAYLGPSRQCRVSSEFDVVDMEYYDVYLGADLLPVYLKEHPNCEL